MNRIVRGLYVVSALGLTLSLAAPINPAHAEFEPSQAAASSASLNQRAAQRVMRVTVDPARVVVSWAYPSKSSQRFHISAQRTTRAKARIFTITSSAAGRSRPSFVLPWSALGPIKIRVVERKKVAGKVRWIPGQWSEPAMVSWGTSATVSEANSTGNMTAISMVSDAQEVVVRLSGGLTPDGSASIAVTRTVKPRLGRATLTVEGAFDYVTVQGRSGSRKGAEATSVVSRHSIRSLEVLRLLPAEVALQWQSVGDAQVTSIRRMAGTQQAATENDGVAIVPSAAGLTDRNVVPGSEYTYTLFADTRLGPVEPVSIQVRTPAVATSTADDTSSWVLAPGTLSLRARDFELRSGASRTADRSSPELAPLVHGSTASVWVTYLPGVERNLLGAPIILPHSGKLPGGFLGVVAEQRGSQLRLIQAPMTTVVEKLDAPITASPPPAVRMSPGAGLTQCVGIDTATAVSLPTEISFGNLKAAGDGEIDGANTNIWLRPTVDVTLKGRAFTASVTAKCTIEAPIPPVQFALGPVPMVAKFSGGAGIEMTISGSTPEWTTTYRVGVYVRADRSGAHMEVVNDRITPDLAIPDGPEVRDFKWDVTFGGFAGVQVGPGVGAQAAGVVAGLTLDIANRISLKTEPGAEWDEFGTCLVLDPGMQLTGGFAGTVWFEVAYWSHEWDFVELTKDFTIALPPGRTKLFCMGGPPAYQETVDGDLDGDGVRDVVTVTTTKKNFPIEVRVSATLSSTGKTVSTLVGEDQAPAFDLSLRSVVPVDGRRGSEIVIGGQVGASTVFDVILTLSQGALKIVRAPATGPTAAGGASWEILNRWFGFTYHARRVEDGKVIVSRIDGSPRSNASDRKDEVLHIRQYEWANGNWILLDDAEYLFEYPTSIEDDFDLSSLGKMVGSSST